MVIFWRAAFIIYNQVVPEVHIMPHWNIYQRSHRNVCFVSIALNSWTALSNWDISRKKSGWWLALKHSKMLATLGTHCGHARIRASHFITVPTKPESIISLTCLDPQDICFLAPTLDPRYYPFVEQMFCSLVRV